MTVESEMRALLVAVLTSISVPAFAQSSLGITGADFVLGMTQDEAGDSRSFAAAGLDVAITSAHGFQGDLRFSDTAGGGIGMAAAHLYLAPREGQKYGLFAQVSDLDGRAMLWGAFGAEGMVSFSTDTLLEVRGGMGAADEGGLDFVFAGGALVHALSESLTLEASLDLADFDEAAFRATAYDAALTARYSPEGAPWGLYASVIRSGLTGRDGAPGETRLGLGLTLSLGTTGGARPDTRLFRSPDPVAPLVRRGLW